MRTPLVALALSLGVTSLSREAQAQEGPGEGAQPVGAVLVVPVAVERDCAPPPPPPGPLAVSQRAPPWEGPHRLGFKYLPGVAASGLDVGAGSVRLQGPMAAHAAGLEYRLSRFFALRADGEFRTYGQTLDVGLKGWLAPSAWVLRPYLSAALSVSRAELHEGAWVAPTLAGGLDVFIGRYFFLEAEVRARPWSGPAWTNVPSLAAFAGVGVAFF